MNLIMTNAIACPYLGIEERICKASCSAMEIDEEMKMKYCTSDDFDDCPIFLVKRLIRKG